jgi:Skp family chaperone for outer membrane proteins
MSRIRIALAAAAIAACATAALAQTAGNNGPAPAPTPYGHHDPIARMKNMCTEHFARSVGRMAYLEAKLQLTPDQQPLWANWRQAMATGAEKQRDDCLADVPAAGTKPTALDRDAHIEKMMAAKVETLQAARPALEALYASLTPDQRASFDRPMSMDGHRGWRHRHASEGQPL